MDRQPPSDGRDFVDSPQGARWQDLPEKYPHPSACWRRDWEEHGVWLKIWRAFLSELNQRRHLEWSEAFLDGSFAPAKKGRRRGILLIAPYRSNRYRTPPQDGRMLRRYKRCWTVKRMVA